MSALPLGRQGSIDQMTAASQKGDLWQWLLVVVLAAWPSRWRSWLCRTSPAGADRMISPVVALLVGANPDDRQGRAGLGAAGRPTVGWLLFACLALQPRRSCSTPAAFRLAALVLAIFCGRSVPPVSDPGARAHGAYHACARPCGSVRRHRLHNHHRRLAGERTGKLHGALGLGESSATPRRRKRSASDGQNPSDARSGCESTT